MKELEVKKVEETKRQVKEEAYLSIISKKDPVVSMNIGGQIFKCSHSVLTSVKDSLFEKLYENGNRVNEVLFYDRIDYSTTDIIRRVLEKHTILK